MNWGKFKSDSGFVMPLVTLLLTQLLLLNCKVPPPGVKLSGPVTVRIGILEQKPRIDFSLDGPVNFANRRGNITVRGVQGGHWRVEVLHAEPAEVTYRLSAGTTKDRIKAEEIVRSLGNKGLPAHIVRYERPSDLSLRYLRKSVYHVILNEQFRSEKEAKTFQRAIQGKTGSEIMAVPHGEAKGTLRFTNLDSKYSFDSDEAVRLSTKRVEIADVEVGSGFHWEKNESRSYGGSIEFLLDDFGLITAVNELSLEEYLKGVVPSEMPARFPLEALKAQAIAARVEAIAKIGLRHPEQPFDLCDDVHCQVFSGTSQQARTTNKAVENTRGIFMVYRNKIAEAFYSGVCGGHTESNENVWLMEAKPYLRGILDKDRRGAQRAGTSLQDPKQLKRWVETRPDVFCNTLRRDVPASVSYSEKYFRWQVEYTRNELEQSIRDKTGEDFGSLLNLVAKKRGLSGRLMELEVVGTKSRFIIDRELPIRQALSKNTLYSACFYVVREGKSGGLPNKFVFKGAGWGHGVGMCQVGAAVMANSGKRFDEILTHYYRGVVLEVLYD